MRSAVLRSADSRPSTISVTLFAVEERRSARRSFLRGIEEHRETLAKTVFRRPVSDWRRFVDRDWLEPFFASTGSITFGHTILWRTISYELWVRRVWG